jgi:dTDP-4-dehydrorhamnose 3,5-epimerase
MKIRALSIEGAFEITPRQFPDGRGLFLESFRGDRLAEATGHQLDIVQTNVSVSSRGTVRGVHFADVPPSQAKYVTTLSGSFIDFVIDIRVGSPTFGQWDSVLLDTVDRRAIYLAEGLGHAIFSLEDDSTVMYLCSATYDPVREHAINPLDPEIGLAMPAGFSPVLSPKDAAAPSLNEAAAQGLLPRYDECVRYYAKLASGASWARGTPLGQG